MTERKIKRRQRYKERRQKWILINSVALAVIVLVIAGLLIAHHKMSEESYIDYAESSSVKYSVKIPKGATFYSEYLEEFAEYADENGDLWIPSNYAYPTEVATIVKIDINYFLEVCAPDIDYVYTYRITAHPEVIDGSTKNKFPMPKTTLEEVTEPQYENSNTKLNIRKSFEIDYHYYNEIVKKFEKQMDIRNATENLIITMEVEVVGMSETLRSNSENTCVIMISMPLNDHAFDVKYSTNSSNCGDCKILDNKDEGELVYLFDTAKTLGVVAAALLVYLLVGMYLTKNKDVAYYTKVQRLVSNYRSFIQKVVGGFDVTGYQIIEISTFREMLAIRDTIQSPILMSENTDKTRTQFFIPTGSKILYLFDVKVDNYDKLYKKHPEMVDDSIINTSAAHVVKAAPEAPEAPVATPAAAPVASAQPATSVTNNYSSVTNVHNNGDRSARKEEKKARKDERRARKNERKSLREVSEKIESGKTTAPNTPAETPAPEAAQTAPVANPAPVNPQYVPANAQPVYFAPVANGQPVYYAPVVGGQAPVVRNGYATSGCKSASLCVNGQQKVVTNQGGCYPCKTTVNVMLGGCDGAHGENVVNVMTNGCQDKVNKK